jgi:SAM-dependent methyltransferase
MSDEAKRAPYAARVDAIARLLSQESGTAVARGAQVGAYLIDAGMSPPSQDQLLDPVNSSVANAVARQLALKVFLDRNGLTERAEREMRQFCDLLRSAVASTAVPGLSDYPDVPERFRRGAQTKDQRGTVNGAVRLLKRLAAAIGKPDLAKQSILDIGCGTRFAQAFYGRGVPVGRYHGVDVDKALIDFLQEHVRDERLSFKFIDVYNERYHKGGARLSTETDIGAAGRLFDVICLFSVFTHMVPDDVRAMLALLRRYVKADGHLVFTAFIDDSVTGEYLDLDPSQPLWQVKYREQTIRGYAQEAGWSVLSIGLEWSQHMAVCRPV